MPHTILLVDDSPTHRSLIKVFLMGRDCRFIEADSGSEALSLLDAHDVDLAIVDIVMPGMSGIDLVRAIRRHADPGVRRLPVIVLSAQSMQESEGMAAGASACLQKPVSSAGVAEVVDQLLPAGARDP